MTGELGVGLEAVDRADLGEQLGRGERTAAWQLEQRRRRPHRPLFEFAIELEDRAGERAATPDQVAGDTHLHVLLSSGEPAADAIEMCRTVESFRRHGEGRVELVQMPTQPLLRPPPLVDEIIAVIDQQLQLAKRLLIGPRATQARLRERSSGDSERVDRIRLATRSACTTFRRHQLRRYPHQLLAGREQLSLEPTRQLPAVL